MKNRKQASGDIKKLSIKISKNERSIQTNELEIADLESFVVHLQALSEKLSKAHSSSEMIGKIEFTHCPACLAFLADGNDTDHCVLCGSETHPEQERSRYLQIKMDIDIQIRESLQLLDQKMERSKRIAKEQRSLRQIYSDLLSEFSVRYELSTSPRNSFVAERYQRLGQIDREQRELGRLQQRALEIQQVSERKAKLQEETSLLRDRLKPIETASGARRRRALMLVSEKAKRFLGDDLDRQVEFKDAKSVEVNFRDNSILVDGDLNFAESSNVLVKNAVILALLSAATIDEKFFHPRFLLMDNIEDKGMEQARSYNFQEIIVGASESAPFVHQIIYTKSMFNPNLENEEYVVGPYYTHERRTLGRPQGD